jgi:Zn-dependent protease
MEELSTIQKIAVMAMPLVFAIVFHEVAHGWVANRLGDHTAKDMGRLTLNPIPHIDLFGTILMPLMLFLLTDGRMLFGYAKPVPINPYNFKDPKKGMALSSLAGPGVNIVMAVICSFLLRVVMAGLEGIAPEPVWGWFSVPVTLMLGYGVIINVVLAVLNMIPIPPLDGSRVVYWLLPPKPAAAYYRLEPYGTFILMGLIMLGLLGRIMTPIIKPLLALLLGSGGF